MKVLPLQGSTEALLGAWLCLLCLLWTGHAVHTPTQTTATTTSQQQQHPSMTPHFLWSLSSSSSSSSCTTTTTAAAASSSSFLSIFGVSKRIPSLAALAVRGGHNVLEPSSLPYVEALLLRASSEGKLVVIDFSATWCGPCKMIAPLFQELSDAMPEVLFLKIDVDENPDTAAKYNVSAMPTFVFVKQGIVVDRLMGANPARLQELLEEHKY